MSPIAIVHTALGVAALASGAAVVVLPKGTPRHRRIGRLYTYAMALLCGLSFGIRNSTPFFGGYGMFHLMAVVSAVTLWFGVREAQTRRRPDWLEHHLTWMLWSYVGLLMATGSHVYEPVARAIAGATGSPGLAFSATGFLMWGVPVLVARRWIPRVAAQQAGVVAA